MILLDIAVIKINNFLFIPSFLKYTVENKKYPKENRKLLLIKKNLLLRNFNKNSDFFVFVFILFLKFFIKIPTKVTIKSK